MRALHITGLVVASLLLSATAANAFSTDDRTLNDSNGAPKFSDPDDQTPSSIVTLGTKSGFGQDNNNSGQNSGTFSPSAAPFSPSNSYTPAAR